MLCQECDGHVVKHHNNNVRIWERLKMDSGTTIIVQVDIRACSPGPLFQTSHSSRGNLTFHCSFGRHAERGLNVVDAEKLKITNCVRVPTPSRHSQWIKSFGLHQAPAVHICNSNSYLSPCPCFEINVCLEPDECECVCWTLKCFGRFLSDIRTPNFKTQVLESKELRVLTRMQMLFWHKWEKMAFFVKKVF